MLPRSLGGTDCETNLITLCGDCHGRIHGMVRRDISALTKAGLRRAKERGQVLGGDRGVKPSHEAAVKGAAALRAKATARASDLSEIIAEIKAEGAASLREIAAGLNAKGIPTARGGEWSAVQVSRVLSRV